MFFFPILAQTAAPEAAQGLFSSAATLFKLGGPVMWPIALLSVVGVAIAIERFFAFWRYNAANLCFSGTQKKLIGLAREGRFEEALQSAAQADSPVCRILAQALENRDAGFLETLEAASQLELDRLRRGLSLLDTVITAAPMIGILGTVTGIMTTFRVFNESGLDNPLGAAAGIAEALITTAAGLIAALSCLFPFNFFVSHLKRRTIELEQVTHQFEIACNIGAAKVSAAAKQGGSPCA
jgi:biopolymer transport protein ExbB